MTEKKVEKSRWETLIVILAVWLARGFALMLALGALHNDWTVKVPALGFWACLAVSAVLPGGMKNR